MKLSKLMMACAMCAVTLTGTALHADTLGELGI